MKRSRTKVSISNQRLRRTFLLIDALHGVKDSDKQLLAILRQESVPHQIILSKVDKVLFPNSRRIPSENAMEYHFSLLRRSMEEVRQILDARDGGKSSAVGEILACSAERIIERSRKLGIDGVRWTVLVAAGLAGGKNMMPQERTSDFFKDDDGLD
jgi:GTP-binding protein